MSVESYLAARSEFTAIKAELQGYSQIISRVGSALTGTPDKLMFANQPIGLPAEVALSGYQQSFDAAQWPSVEQIMRLLERYHRGRSDLQNAWAAVPQDHREGLKSPGDLLRNY